MQVADQQTEPSEAIGPLARVLCRHCGQSLTKLLERLPESFVPEWVDHQNIIPEGMFWIASDDMNTLEGRGIIHRDDRRHLHDHSDTLRFQGCCGPSAGQVNQLCECGAVVATDVADCWTSYYVHFEPDHTTLKYEDQP
jgi:hypothetical protein